MTYTVWSYFPRNVRPPSWAGWFVEVVSLAEGTISTVEHKTGLESDAVLNELSPGLIALGYAVESGKTKNAKIHRPVLFGENGTPQSTMRSMPKDADDWHDRWSPGVSRRLTTVMTSCRAGCRRISDNTHRRLLRLGSAREVANPPRGW